MLPLRSTFYPWGTFTNDIYLAWCRLLPYYGSANNKFWVKWNLNRISTQQVLISILACPKLSVFVFDHLHRLTFIVWNQLKVHINLPLEYWSSSQVFRPTWPNPVAFSSIIFRPLRSLRKQRQFDIAVHAFHPASLLSNQPPYSNLL